MKNLLQYKNKIRNLKEAYKNSRKTTSRSYVHFNFQHIILNLRTYWGVEMSWQSRTSNILELKVQKLKETVTMNLLRWSVEKKEDREVLREHMSIMNKFSSDFLSKCSCVNLHSYVSFFYLCLIQQTCTLPLSFFKRIAFCLTVYARGVLPSHLF